MSAQADTRPIAPNHRILVVDDNEDIHADFRRILAPKRDVSHLDALERALTRAPKPVSKAVPTEVVFTIDSAFQGAESLEMVKKAAAAGSPYALAFVDVRMPPGWDGIETVSRLWQAYPQLEVVLCTAYSDYSWEDILERLQRRDGLVILKKPFDNIEVIQLAHSLCEKWYLKRCSELRVDVLERAVLERTSALQEANTKLLAEIRERERMAADRERIAHELRQSQKLEAVGRLAAGVAHEINTPMQYIGGAVDFMGTSVEHVSHGMRALVQFLEHMAPRIPGDAALDAVHRALAEADLEFVLGEMPAAVADARIGIKRVGEIVRSMREFAYRGSTAKEETDLNRPLLAALDLARAEYKYCADLESDLADIPHVVCNVAEMGQVFLNLIINAAHAMKTVHAQTGQRGQLKVRSRLEGDQIVVEIGDTGGGIPEAVRDRIFEPFFTTKPFGQGTGQGLAIAHSIVVEKHAGTLTFDSVPGVGTVFHVRIPLNACATDEVKVAS
jgi:two-component system NtrC family sensor kinase